MKKIVPMYPWPMHPKVAEAMAAIPDTTPVQALPGGPGPVLAIRKAPNFVADAIVVMSPGRLPEAVRVVIGDGLEMVTIRDQVTTVLGAGASVKEMHETLRSGGVHFQ